MFWSDASAQRISTALGKVGCECSSFSPHGQPGSTRRDLGERLGQRVFDSEMVDRLDFFLAKLHENGIYADLSLHVSRELTPEEGFPKLVNVPW